MKTIHFNFGPRFPLFSDMVLFLQGGALSSFPDQRLVVEPIPVSFDIFTGEENLVVVTRSVFYQYLSRYCFLSQTGIILLLLVRITVIFLESFKFLAKCL